MRHARPAFRGNKPGGKRGVRRSWLRWQLGVGESLVASHGSMRLGSPARALVRSPTAQSHHNRSSRV